MCSTCLLGKTKTKKLYVFLILKDKGLNFSGCSINFSLFLIKFAIDTVTTCTWWELATLACHPLPHPFCRWPLSYEIHSQTHVCSLSLTICVIMGSWLSFLGLIPLPRSEQQFGWHCFPREWSCFKGLLSSQEQLAWQGMRGESHTKSLVNTAMKGRGEASCSAAGGMVLFP